MRIAIRDGHIIDPKNGIDGIADLHIDGEVIVPLSDSFEPEQIIDATNRVVCPGLVDLSFNLNRSEVGDRELFAAAAAGVTTVALPPNSASVIDSQAAVELVRNRTERDGYAKTVQVGALTKNLEGIELSNMGALKRAGCVALSNGMQHITNSLIMLRTLEYAANHDITVILHSQDSWLNNNGCMHDGSVSTRLGLNGIPDSAEIAGVARDLILIRDSGVQAHFSGISSRGAIELIRSAQQNGANITADVAAHSLYLTEVDVGEFNSLFHLIPPLRSERDRDELVKSVVNGSIQAICSDHQPHNEDAKAAPFADTKPGASTVETLLPLTLRLAREHDISISEALATVTYRPANILGIEAGTLSDGAIADITIYDPTEWWQINADTLQSGGKNSPFLNWEMQGKVHHTIINGKTVYERS